MCSMCALCVLLYALHTVHVHARTIYTRPTKNSKDYFSTAKVQKVLLASICSDSYRISITFSLRWAPFLCYICMIWYGAVLSSMYNFQQYFIPFTSRHFCQKPFRFHVEPHSTSTLHWYQCSTVVTVWVCWFCVHVDVRHNVSLSWMFVCLCIYHWNWLDAFATEKTVPNHRHLQRWARLGRLEILARFCSFRSWYDEHQNNRIFHYRFKLFFFYIYNRKYGKCFERWMVDDERA